MQLFCDTERQPSLFNVFNDTELLEEDLVDCWDVMDQFPPDNSYEQFEDGGPVISAGAVSPSVEIQPKASPPTLPQCVYPQLTSFLILENF